MDSDMNNLVLISMLLLMGSMSPGPDTVIVMKHALGGSSKFGISASFGIALSLMLHSIFINLGISILIAHNKHILTAIKLCGCVYLLYLGIKMIAASNTSKYSKTQRHSTFQAFKEGLFCNLLNPKSILFILSLFTIVIGQQTTAFEKLLYVCVIMLIPLSWFCLLSYLVNIKIINKYIMKIQNLVFRIMAVFIIFVGINILFLEIRDISLM